MADLKNVMTEYDARMIMKLVGININQVGWFGIAQRITSCTFKQAEEYEKDGLKDAAIRTAEKAERMLKYLVDYENEYMTQDQFIEFFDKERPFDIFGWVGVMRCLYLYYSHLSKTSDELQRYDRNNIYKDMSEKLYWLTEQFQD